MFERLPQPITPKLLIRVLVLVIIFLAFLAGYYHSALEVEQLKNQQLQHSLEEITEEMP